MRIVLVHGWNVRDAGAGTVDRLAPALEALGHTVDKDEADYGFLSWEMFSCLARRALRQSIVDRLTRAFVEADVVVTHSNGANFAHQALNAMTPDDKRRVLIHFSPALNRSTPRPSAAQRMLVCHTQTDSVVKMATYLPFHPWGRMGAYGPSYEDPRTRVMDYTGLVETHSGWFALPAKPRVFAALIHNFSQEALAWEPLGTS